MWKLSEVDLPYLIIVFILYGFGAFFMLIAYGPVSYTHLFWVDIFDLDVYINSGNIFMNVTIVIIAAFVITSLIGRIRIYIVDKIMQLMPKLDGIF